MSAITVAAVQGQPWHFEVLAAVIYTFWQIGSNVTAFTSDPAVDMQTVIRPWFPHEFQPFSSFEPTSCDFDVVVLVSFPDGHEDLAKTIGSKACAAHQRFMVIIHNPGNLRAHGVFVV